MSMPKPPSNDTPKKSGKLTTHESKFILDRTLKPKHREDEMILKFIDEFVRCKSVSEASNNVGVAQSIGYKWRHRKDIADAISKLIDKSAIKYGIDSSEIFERAKEIVDFDPISMQNADGTFKSNLHDIEPSARRNLKKLEVKNIYNQVEDINGMKSKIIVGEIIKYEFYDKLKGIELVGTEKDMFKKTTKVEHGVTKDMASILLESVGRAERAIEVIDITPKDDDES